MKIWLKVTDDEYEFPLQIADTSTELAKKCNVSVNTVLSSLCRERKGVCWSCYKCIEVEDEET